MTQPDAVRAVASLGEEGVTDPRIISDSLARLLREFGARQARNINNANQFARYEGWDRETGEPISVGNTYNLPMDMVFVDQMDYGELPEVLRGEISEEMFTDMQTKPHSTMKDIAVGEDRAKDGSAILRGSDGSEWRYKYGMLIPPDDLNRFQGDNVVPDMNSQADRIIRESRDAYSATNLGNDIGQYAEKHFFQAGGKREQEI